jgi:hypothetical protein
MKLILNEWFRLMDYKKWSVKYPAELNERHFNALKNQVKWVTDNSIHETPTTFINSQKTQSTFDFSDLRYMID